MDLRHPENRKMKLLQDIERYCMRYKYQKRETVLMVGRTGVGKSAALNTIAKVVNGEYFPIANVGHCVAQSKTKELLTYRNCGAVTDIERKSTERKEDEIFKKITKYLPHIIDFAGLDDVDTPSLRELFELLVDGCIPPGTTLEALEREQKEHGVGRLRSIYPEPNPVWKVTKIMFVHSCQQSVPCALIKCLLSTLNATLEGSNTLRYTGDVFVLITHYDRVDSKEHQSDNHNEDSASSDKTHNVQLEDFNRIESTLAKMFSIRVVLGHNIRCFTSYCSDTGYDNESVDELSIMIIKFLVTPTTFRDPVHVLSSETPRATGAFCCWIFIVFCIAAVMIRGVALLMSEPDSRRH